MSADLTAGLDLIMSIPDDVLEQGDAATAAWLDAEGWGTLPEGRANVLGCVGAIATVIASTAFPAAKILKIKNSITALGGVQKAVQLFWGASFSYEKIRALGGAAAALAAEIIGISEIKRNCFA